MGREREREREQLVPTRTDGSAARPARVKPWMSWQKLKQMDHLQAGSRRRCLLCLLHFKGSFNLEGKSFLVFCS